MSTVLLTNFTGIFPRMSATGLPDNAAQEARNVKLQSGEIRSWKKPVAVQKVLQDAVTSIFKMDSATGTSVWCEWTQDTDVCYGPVADESEYRIYYSEGGVCKKTNWELCSSGSGPCPRNWYYMGTPYPETALELTANRVKNDPDKWKVDHPDDEYEEYSSDNTDNRAYCYTYVSKFGSIVEESAPSEATSVVCDTAGGSVEVSGFADPPIDHYNIIAIRIYRAVTGSSSAVYLLVDQLDLKNHKLADDGTSLNGARWHNRTYTDKRTAAQLGKELDSLYYTPPPKGLRGLVSMPNGFLAGFVANQIWFCEPYLPHAWPSTYMLTTDSPIVGLGVYGNTLVVCTTRQPFTVSGTHPASMAQEKQPMMQPCISKRSIAYDQYGVLYASPYGLVAIAGGQMDVFTRELCTQDEWQEYNPTSMLAAMYNNLYMCAYKKTERNSMLVFSRGDQPALINYDFEPVAMHVERGTGRLFCLNAYDNKIYQMDADPVNKEAYEWRSKRFVNPYRTAFSAMKLDADYNSNIDYEAWESTRKALVKYNSEVWETRTGQSLLGELHAVGMNHFEVNGSLLKSLMTKADFRTVTVTVFAEGKEVYSKQFTSIVACRLPAATGYSWEVRITGNVDVRSFSMSTAMSELAAPN